MDKVILITGASSGIGAATARALVTEGARVALFARSEAKLRALEDELGAEQTLAVPGDVTVQADVDSFVTQTLDRFRHFDAVFANAGGWAEGKIAEGDPDEWARLIDVNVTGVLRTLRATVPHLIARGGGHVLLTGSISGRAVYPGSTVYGATKHAIYGIAEGLRKEVYQHGVSVGVISPGYTRNEFWGETDPAEQRRAAEEGTALHSDNIAAAVVYALSQPPNVNVADLLILPTRQDVPSL